MFDLTRDFQSLTDFRRKTASFARDLQRSNRPLVLTVNGKPGLVVQSAEAYQRLLDIAAHSDASEGIRQGLEDSARGRTKPAREVFAAIRRKHGLSR